MEKKIVKDTSKISFSGSGRICAVVGCSNSQRKQFIWRHSRCEKHNGMLHSECPCLVPFSLHSFPKNEPLKLQWIAALNRKGYVPGKTAKVCSIHFLNGSPSFENSVPQLSLGYQKKVVHPRRPLKRSNVLQNQASETFTDPKSVQELPMPASSTSTEFTSTLQFPVAQNSSTPLESEEIDIVKTQKTVECQATVSMCNAETQWEDTSLADHTYAQPVNLLCTRMIGSTQVDMPPVTLSNMSSDDAVFYTGLQLTVFAKLLALLSVHARNFPFLLDLEDQLLLVLMRLRLGLLFYDLGRRFRVSTALASTIVSTWLPMMASQLKNLIFWLPRETIRATLPCSFKDLFPNTTCIIDCTEVFISRPTVLKARAQTYSDYKSHNTMKFLVGIAPNGFVMFLSKCFGGRASDKFIVLESNFLQFILPGDEIMADRGFLIEEELAMKGAKLNMPTFTKGKKQLSEVDVTETRRVASRRIFVECAIGRIKEYRILRHPLAFGKKNRTADDIVLVCTALSNLKTPLVKPVEL